MPDYNIYIHSSISASSGDATKPWSSSRSSSTNPWNSDDSFSSNAIKNVSKVSGVMMNPDGLISQGVGMLIKAVPWIAIAMVVAKIIDRVVSTSTSYNSLETGDYKDTVNWNNFKSTTSWIFRPFSTAWNEIQAQNKYRIDDYRKNQQRALLGDSVINSFYNRGV